MKDEPTLKIALCNEVLQALTFEQQCRFAADLGYDALEVAPYTLNADPTQINDREAGQYARIAADHGLAISGLHWLLVAPSGLSIVDPDDGVRRRTKDVMARLVDLCAALGGRYLVHGSPRQRAVPAGSDYEETWARARDCFAHAGERAHACGLTYCVEPLSPRETDLINTVADGVRMVEEIHSPGLQTMIDCSAAGQAETQPVADLITEWAPSGHIAHIQVNDPNRRAPGQGDLRFGPVLRSLHAQIQQGHYTGIIAVEPFDYVPDGPGCAARAIGYLRALLQEIEAHD